MADDINSGGQIEDAEITQGHEQGQEDSEQHQQEDTSAPSPEGSRDYGENQEPDATSPDNNDPDLLARRENQAIGKLRQVQIEAQEAKERAQQYEQTFSKVVENASRTPQTYKNAMMTLRGVSEQEADAYIQRIKDSGQAPASWYSYGEQGRQQAVQQEQRGNPNQMPDVYSLIKKEIADYENRKQQEEQQRNYLTEISDYFFEQVPEMNPKTMPDERKQDAAVLMDAVQVAAQRKVQQNPELDFKDALIQTYKTMTGRTDEQLAQMREEAKLEGYLESNTSRATTGAPTKGGAPKHKSHGLTPDQMRQAKAEGYSYERFAELLNSNETTVG